MRIPRWYHRLMLGAFYLWSALILVATTIIGLCVIADWVFHLGWGYPWWSVPFLAISFLVAFAINRGAIAEFRSLRRSS